MDSFPYLSELRRIYHASQSSGLYVGLTTEKKILAGELQQRKILVLTGAEFVPRSVAAEILHWVENGGTLISSPNSLLADEYARPAETLSSLGVRLLRIEPPRLKRGEQVVTDYNLADLPRMPLIQDKENPYSLAGVTLEAAGGRQILECDNAAVMARSQDRTPALLRLSRGRGVIYWLSAPLKPASWGRFLSVVALKSGLKPELRVITEQGVEVPALEYRLIRFDQAHLAYFYNDSDRDLRLILQPAFKFTRLLDRRAEAPLLGSRLVLPAHETAIVEFRN